MAKMIVIEGCDQVGKQTQSRLLAAFLNERGYRAALVECPIRDGLTHPVIYWMLKNGKAVKYPTIFQFIQHLNKKIFQAFMLPFIERENHFVIMDRWSLSSIAYGTASGADHEWMMDWFRSLRTPDLNVFLDGKSHSSRADDDYEKDSKLQATARKTYQLWVTSNPKNCVTIDCQGSQMSVHHRILEAVRSRNLL